MRPPRKPLRYTSGVVVVLVMVCVPTVIWMLVLAIKHF